MLLLKYSLPSVPPLVSSLFSPLTTEENLMAEVNQGADAFVCIQPVRLQQKEQVELIFSAITQTNPFFKPTRIPDGVTERKHHLCAAVEPVGTAAVFVSL